MNKIDRLVITADTAEQLLDFYDRALMISSRVGGDGLHDFYLVKDCCREQFFHSAVLCGVQIRNVSAYLHDLKKPEPSAWTSRCSIR